MSIKGLPSKAAPLWALWLCGHGFFAWMQGRAAAADAFTKAGKGFANYIIILGVIETVPLFVMVFLITALPKAYSSLDRKNHLSEFVPASSF